MNKIYFCVMLCLMLFLLGGCATTAAYMSECFDPKCQQYKDDNWFYPAIKTDVKWLTQPKNPEAGPIAKTFGYTAIIIDFPISFVFDTVFLPFKAGGHYLTSKKTVSESTQTTESKEPSSQQD
jgi:uncharacterized protein YceK